MCGRFTLRKSGQQVAEEFGLAEAPGWGPRFNVAPTQQVLAVRATEKGLACSLMRWGLLPKWAAPGGAPLINAKAETAAEKPAFRAAFKARRCLVPADGFYEWLQQGKKKQPYLFSLRGGGLFAFVGLRKMVAHGGEVGREADKLVRQHRREVARMGAVARLLIEGEEVAVFPLDDADALEQATPKRSGGKLWEFDTAKVKARREAMVRNCINAGAGTVVIVLGAAHDLSEQVRGGATGWAYVRVTTGAVRRLHAEAAP